MAYEHAMKCFIANGHASGVLARSGASPKTIDAYEVSARQAFDAALKLGGALGYSKQRITEDFGLTQTRELPPLVSDATYYSKAKATCRSLGLMPND